MKLTVKKHPKKSAEAYNRFFDGESRGVFLKKIAEAIVHGGKKETKDGIHVGTNQEDAE